MRGGNSVTDGILHGVDLSSWQRGLRSADILTGAGVSFAILKLSEGRSLPDASFTDHYNMCRGAGIPVGAYVYSHALSPGAARAEADFALATLSGRELQLPVFLDIEGELLSKAGYSPLDCALSFAARVREGGCRPGVYASKWVYDALLSARELCAAGIAIWCAAYNNQGPGMDCDIWQRSNTGRLPGYDGYVDLDTMFTPLLDTPEESGEEEPHPAPEGEEKNNQENQINQSKGENKMKKTDIINKLTSRKFWIAVASFVSGLILAFRGGEELATTVSGCIMAAASVVAYIIGEGLVDANAASF